MLPPPGGLTFSTGWDIVLVWSVMVDVCLASDDVYLERGVTKIKAPCSAVKHYWLSPSVDEFFADVQRYRKPICISEAPERGWLSRGALRDSHCQQRHARLAVCGVQPTNETDS